MYPLKFETAVLEKINKPLKVKNIYFLGPLKRGQVLVKLFFSGICGKQIDEISGVQGADKFLPHCLGHEGSGLVIDIGPGVKRIKKGQNVILHWIKTKGINSEKPEYYDANNKIINAGWVTTFNEYTVASENRLTVIKNRINLKDAALFGCAIPTGLGAVFNEATIKEDSSVLIYGAGGIGLFMIQALKIMSVKKIIAVDIKNKSIKLAKDLGAKYVFNAKKKDIKSKIKNITNNKGADVVFINIGNSKSIEKAIDYCSTPGKCIQVGVPNIKTKTKIDMFSVMHGKQIFGSMGGSTKPHLHMKKYIDIYKKKLINVKKIINKTFTLKDINKAIKFHKKNPGKVIIKF